jgi:acyl-coenzyme A thioesterase PaaI-like protein
MHVTTEEALPISTQNGHSRCLLCGERNPFSLRLVFEADDEGGVKTRFKSHDGLQGYDEMLHGGVIAALLDAAMTHCLFHHGVQAVTGDLHVRFVNPVSCDASLEIRAWVVSSRPPLYRLRAEITQDRRIMAWAESKFIRRSAR